MNKILPLLLILAGCGGGGSDPPTTPVEPTPTTVTCNTLGTTTTCRTPGKPIEGPMPNIVVTPAPAPVARVAPNGTTVPAPVVSDTTPAAPVVAEPSVPAEASRGSGEPPTASPAPTTPTPAATPAPGPATPPADAVDGRIVLAALRAGIPIDRSKSFNPYSGYDRELLDETRGIYYMGERMQSYTAVMFPWLKVGTYGEVQVQADLSGPIATVVANSLTLTGPSLDLATADIRIDQVAGTWRSGDWYAQLIVKSTDDAAQMNVCWNVQLPPPPPVQGPPGSEPVVRTQPLKRLSCGRYGRYAVTAAVGGEIVDDFGGSIRRFAGRW